MQLLFLVPRARATLLDIQFHILHCHILHILEVEQVEAE